MTNRSAAGSQENLMSMEKLKIATDRSVKVFITVAIGEGAVYGHARLLEHSNHPMDACSSSFGLSPPSLLLNAHIDTPYNPDRLQESLSLTRNRETSR